MVAVRPAAPEARRGVPRGGGGPTTEEAARGRSRRRRQREAGRRQLGGQAPARGLPERQGDPVSERPGRGLAALCQAGPAGPAADAEQRGGNAVKPAAKVADKLTVPFRQLVYQSS